VHDSGDFLPPIFPSRTGLLKIFHSYFPSASGLRLSVFESRRAFWLPWILSSAARFPFSRSVFVLRSFLVRACQPDFVPSSFSAIQKRGGAFIRSQQASRTWVSIRPSLCSGSCVRASFYHLCLQLCGREFLVLFGFQRQLICLSLLQVKARPQSPLGSSFPWEGVGPS
jgi:hypothetical protein